MRLASRTRRLAIGWVAAVLIGHLGVVSSEAGLMISSRLSRIRFDGTNLGTGGGGPDEEITETGATTTFNDSITGTGSFIEPSGAMNTGSWEVRQDTQILANKILSAAMQLAAVATDSGVPIINVESLFEIEFSVAARTTIELDGSIVGSSLTGERDFARVTLAQKSGPAFATIFTTVNDVFPFVTVLDANRTYRLQAFISGDARVSHLSTASSYDLTLMKQSSAAAVPEPSTFVLGVAAIAGVLVRRFRPHLLWRS